MTAFSLRGTTALVALSVSLTLGAPIIATAQETPEVAAPAIAPPPPPAEAPWQAVTRLGLRFEVPPGVEIAAPAEGSREFAVSTIGADGIGARLGLRLLDTAERESMPSPGAPEMAAFLSDLAGLPLTETGVVMEIGGRRMLAYGGSGPVPAAGGRTLDARMLYLIAEEPDADGNALMIAVFSAGLGGGVAADLEAHFVGSLSPEEASADTPPVAQPDEDASASPAGDPAALAATDAPVSDAAASEAPAADPEAALLALADALPLPARVTPDGWQRLDAFGLSLAGPAEAEVRDRRTARHPEISMRLRDRAASTELEIGMATVPAQEVTEMGAAPGTPGFAALLSGRSGLTFVESPRRLLVGDRGMMIYLGQGEGESGPFRGAHVLSVFLVTEDPDADGNWIVIGAAARGYAPEVALDLVSQAIRSVAPDVAEVPAQAEPAPVAEPAPAPDAEAPDVAAIAAAIPDPSGTLPDGWQRIDGLGISLGVPPGLEAETDPSGRGLTLTGRDTAARTEIEMGGLLAGPDVSARFQGLPGTEGFARTLSGWAEVEVRDTGRDLTVAGRPMRLYIAAGMGEETPELGARLTGYYLVTLETDSAGNYLILGGAFRGYPEAEALDLIASAVAGLPPDAPAADGTPAAPAVVETIILPGAADALLPPGMVVTSEERNARSADFFFGDAGGPPHSRITAGFLLGRDVNRQLRVMLHDVQALVEAEIDGLPVWVIHGTATRSLDDQEVTASVGVPAQIVVPRVCENGNPPYLVGALAAPGQEARVDALVATLRLRAPQGATPCPDSVMDEVRGVIARSTTGAVATTPATPPAPVILQAAPTVPPGWTRHVQFGLTFAAPEGMQVRRERTEADAMEYWLQGTDASGQIAQEISIRVFTPAALARMPLQTPDQDGFADMLAEFGDLPVRITDERMMLGDIPLRVFRGDGPYREGGGDHTGRVLYLIAEAPSANGLSPWFVVQTVNQSPEAQAAIEASFLSSLGGQPEIPPQRPETAPPVPQMPPVARQPDETAPSRTPTPPVASTASPEATAWQAARVDGGTEAILAYLAAYPRGLHSGDARAMLRERGVIPPDERRPEPPRVDPEAVDWQRALDENRMEAFWTYLKMWPQGPHADEARARLELLRPPPPPPPARYPQQGK